jgi:predicted amidohydrolase
VLHKPGTDQALITLSSNAKKYSIPALIANCIGMNDRQECDGMTSAWNDRGELIQQLSGDREGILMYDTDTHVCISLDEDPMN